MGKLRKTIQREVMVLLDSTIFTSEDFEIFFGDPESGQYLISLKLKYNPRYDYIISARNHATGRTYPVTKSPGEIEEKESRLYMTLEEALTAIPHWCIEVRNELKADNPLYKDLDALQKTLEEHLTNFSESEEFTVSEIHYLNEKFRELEKRIQDLEANNVITETQSEEMQKGVQQVMQDMEYYPKKTWIKTATNKITKIFVGIAKSPEGSKLLADGARKLLTLD